MAFAYVRGNPDNLTSGGNAAMGDIQGPFYDIRDYLNTGVFADLVGQGILFIGEVRWIAVPNAPALWLPCDGRVISRTTYNKLFAAIGATYGAGDGTNTFGIPDLAGRTAMGAGTGSGLTARTAGQKIGSEASNMPSHNHGGQTGNPDDVTHYHGFQAVALSPGSGTEAFQSGASNRTDNGFYSGNLSVHKHTIASQGGGADNIPPTLVVPAYIYAGV